MLDSELLHIWLTGWTLARRTPPPVALTDCWRVDVGWPEQAARYVFARPSPELARRARMIHEPFVFLKALLPPGAMAAALPPGWFLQSPRSLMVSRNLREQAGRIPQGYRLEQDDRAASLMSDDGVAAASGQVVRVDGHAIFDSIKVEAAHRRRGLGSALMAALTNRACADGARHGVLVATQEGRALYEALGWQFRSPYSSASWSDDIQR